MTPATTSSPPFSRFNPRPPLLAGECHRHIHIRLAQFVSIHARHCWRANATPRACATWTPAGFNPRPPLLAGEWSAGSATSSPSRTFQSTPAIAGGRMSSIVLKHQMQTVSIHARHCWRANVFDVALRTNSELVSIHARHCWRANAPAAARNLQSATFQSTPAIAGGRMPSAQGLNRSPRRFQSTPAIAGGRMPIHRRQVPGHPRFNPRPPLLAGEWRCVVVNAYVAQVSIHARHCWRANGASFWSPPCRAWFQSTPAIAGGRMPSATWPACRSRCFNPRPPLLAGE